jgi:hypothetical protein
MADPFVGARLKVIRAYHHFKTLNGKIDRALKGQRNGVLGGYESDGREYVYRADIRWQPPEDWGLIFGDAIHNLRSALDHVVYDLVIRNQQVSTTKTEFPIYADPNLYKAPGEAAKKLAGVDPTDQKFIEQAQPYHASQPKYHALWVIRALDIIDKHRTLLPALSISSLRGYGAYGDLAEPLTHFGALALNDQDVVFRVPARTHAKGNLQPHFTCDVALGIVGTNPDGRDGEAAAGRPIRVLTVNLYNAVANQLQDLERQILGKSPPNRSHPRLPELTRPMLPPPPCRVSDRTSVRLI